MYNVENRYTSISENDERFGYAAAGHFRAAYRLGHLFAVIAVLLTIGFLIWAFIFMEWFLRGERLSVEENFGIRFFYMVIMAGICVISFLLCGLAIRLCVRGAECSWRADEEKFTATVHGRIITIYYSQVENVLFEEMSFWGKVYGYTVTIKVDGARIVFKQMLDSMKIYTPPEASPFYIIKERAGLIRPVITPEPEPILRGGERFDAPEAPSYESEAPALVSDISESVTTDAPPPETDETAIISNGGFFAAIKGSGIVMAALCVIMVIGIFDMLSDMGGWTFSPLLNVAAFVLLAVIWLAITITLFNIFKGGRRCRFEANSLEMRIFDGKDRRTILYYRDIQRVSWREFRFLLVKRGIEVRVETKYRTYCWRVVDPYKKESFSVEDTPFYLLKDFITREKTDGSSPKKQGDEWNEL